MEKQGIEDIVIDDRRFKYGHTDGEADYYFEYKNYEYTGFGLIVNPNECIMQIHIDWGSDALKNTLINWTEQRGKSGYTDPEEALESFKEKYFWPLIEAAVEQYPDHWKDM